MALKAVVALPEVVATEVLAASLAAAFFGSQTGDRQPSKHFFVGGAVVDDVVVDNIAN